ncbi:hypothetical protein DF18_34425 [Streptomyces rimosus]|nr:hypothetical protein DF18_34425 [Streptomyces rimosus]
MPASRGMPRTRWPPSQECDWRDSLPVSSTPSPSAADTMAPSSGWPTGSSPVERRFSPFPSGTSQYLSCWNA